MAEEHNALKYGPVISKAGSIAAGGGYGDVGISRLGETLQPVIDLWSRPEWALLRSEILFARFADSAAVAARFSSIEFVNPAGSQIVAVVSFVLPTTASEMNLDAGTAIAANPLVTRGRARDSRYRQLGDSSICTITTGDLAAGLVGPQRRFNGVTGGDLVDRQGWVITPGQKLFIIGTAVLTQVTANLGWSERAAFPGELQASG